MLRNVSKSMLYKRSGLRCLSLYQSYNQQKEMERVDECPSFVNSREKVDLSLESATLQSVFPEIREECLNAQLFHHKNYPGLRERYTKLLNYTVNVEPKYISRAIVFLHAYRLLEKPAALTENNLREAAILGWCHKMMDASMIIDDDIADKSDLRYNKPCWHKVEGVGVDKAILDAAFVECCANILMVNHFSSHPQFYNISKTFLLSLGSFNVAQLTQLENHKLPEMEKYNNPMRSYALTVPLISSALYLANIDNIEVHQASEVICKKISEYIDIQGDVLDVLYSSTSGKTGDDISLGRNSWLAIEAYKRSTPMQKKTLEEHYGQDNVKSVEIVRNVYEDLQMKKLFEKFKEDFYENTYRQIHEDLPKTLPTKLYLNILDFAVSGDYSM